MNQYSQFGGYRGRKYSFSNPLANALVVLVGILAIGASLVLGFIAFVTLGSLVLILAAIVGIRVWWFKRRLRRAGRDADPRPASPGQVEVIEGEYRVVSTSRRAGGDDEA